MKKQWITARVDPKTIHALAQELGCSPVLATLLHNRGLNAETAGKFLHPSLSQLSSPHCLKDMDIAVKRIARAIFEQESIMVFGDYDVDGISATVLLFEFLKACNARTSYHIPHRIEEGYGLKSDHVLQWAGENPLDLIITVDCGSASHEAVQTARSLGVDVIITDHHNPDETLPDALAVINPKRRDDPSHLEHLAGVGVAFYLLACLRSYLRKSDFWADAAEPNLKDGCDLVALGTIADVVPMIRENRILTRAGLEVIGAGNRPGVQALLESCAVKTHPEAGDVAFRMAPRLNAAGRIAHAKTAAELLQARDLQAARMTAAVLDHLNIERRQIERKVFDDILGRLENKPALMGAFSLVLEGSDWHPGVIGIVAARLAEHFTRPVVLIVSGSSPARGSGRSVAGIDLRRVLSECRQDLATFGGHRQAAGLAIDGSKIDRFRIHFDRAVQQAAAPGSFLPTGRIDCELKFQAICDQLLNDLEQLQPFGPENPEPIFAAKNVKVVSSRIVGRTHRRMALLQASDSGGQVIDAVDFHIDPGVPAPAGFEQLVFRLQRNRWNGRCSPQIILEKT